MIWLRMIGAGIYELGIEINRKTFWSEIYLTNMIDAEWAAVVWRDFLMEDWDVGSTKNQGNAS